MSTKKLLKTKYQNQNRRFSETFKKQKVQRLIERKISVQQISDLYQVSRTSVYNWIYKYSSLERGTKTVVQMESEEQKTKELLQRVSELERVVGQKQLQLDLNDKIFEYLNEELGYDVKKKYEQMLWNGSD